MARASASTSGSSQGVKQLGQCNPNDPDKVLLSVLKKHGLMIDIPINRKDISETTKNYPYIKPYDTIQALFRKGHFHKVIGVSRSDAAAVFTEFWQRWRLIQADHQVFERIDAGEIDPATLVPLFTHGDGGRGYKKCNVDVFHWQPCLGKGTAASIKLAKKGHLKTKQFLNYKGHSFGTRFLFGLVQGQRYKADKDLWTGFLTLFAQELLALYNEGIVLDDTKWWFVPLGVKADYPFLTKLSNSSRTHSSIRKVAPGPNPNALKGCCIWCLGGKGDVAFEDVNLDAEWVQTIAESPPWPSSNLPVFISMLPHQPSDPCGYFFPDVFHITKSGHGKNYTASGLVYSFYILGQSSVDKSLEVLNIKFRASKISCHFGSFSKDMLGLASFRHYPVGHWSQGSDTPKVFKFLQQLLEDHPIDLARDVMLQDIVTGCKAMHQCMQVMNSCGFWFDRKEAMWYYFSRSILVL
jgi:hypothetical protein